MLLHGLLAPASGIDSSAALRAVKARQVDALMLEKLHLHVDAPAETSKAAIGPDDAMTWCDDAEWVVPDGPTHGACR